jgi:hypothetical protein
MATAAAATPANVLPSLPEAVLHTLFGSTWFGGDDLFAPASHARPAHAAKVHAPTPVRSPLPHQLGYDDGEDEAHVHVRLHNMPSGARVSSSASGATLHIDTGKGAKTHAGSTPSRTGSPGDPRFEIATHQFTGGMAGTSVHPADPHSAGANIAHRVLQKSAPQAASGSASPWSLDSLLHLPGKLAVSAAAWEGRMADDAVEGVGEKLGLAKPQKPGTPRKPGTFEQFNRAYTAAIVGGVEDMVGGLWKTEVYAYQHPIDFYAGIVKRGWDAAKWAVNTDVKILKAGYTAAVESTTAKGRRQLWHDGTQAWDSSVKTALGLYHQTANTIDAAKKSGTLSTLVGDVAGKIVVNVAPALVGAPEISAARIGGSLALKEAAEVGAKTVLKDAATDAAGASARASELDGLKAAEEAAAARPLASREAAGSGEGAFKTRASVIEKLIGVTKQSTKIAKAIATKKIRMSVLGDNVFDIAYALRGGTESTDTLGAFAVGDKIYLRSSSSDLLRDAVHEGTHALDHRSAFSGRDFLWEMRAFSAERDFLLKKGLESQFEKKADIVKFINKAYSFH